MPSFADTFIQEAFRANAAAKDQNAGSGFKLGAEIAQHAEQVKMQQVQVQQKQQELEQAKLAKLVDFVKDARNYQNAGDRNRYLKGAVGLRNTLGIRPEVMPDEQIASFGSDENMGRIASLEAAIGRGELTMTDATAIAADPQRFGAVVPIPADAIKGSPDLNEAQKTYLDRQSRERAAALSASSRVEAAKVPGQSAGGKALAANLAGKFAEYTAGGGRAGMQASLSKLEEAATALETGKVVTGGKTTVIPGFKNEDAQSMINPKMIAMKTQAQSALNSILKVTLGGQFTEAEGVRVLNQVWDDRQKPAENAKRVRSKLNELKNGVKSAETQYIKQGFMTEEEATGGRMIKLNGKEYPEEKLRKLLETNPNSAFAPDIKKALGIK